MTHNASSPGVCDLTRLYNRYLQETSSDLNVSRTNKSTIDQGKEKAGFVSAKEHGKAKRQIKDLLNHGLCLKQNLLHTQGLYYNLLRKELVPISTN
jgi:hypothetical protein